MVRLGYVAVMVYMCMLAVAPSCQAAVNCGMVATDLAPCLDYLRGGASVPAGCCDGVRNLYSQAQTTADRQNACKCMKSAALAVTGINLNNASNLPKICGVNIAYKITPSIDCTKVQ
ncbi:non-specific lipid-transfer protein 1-like [Diospyros lotus]|uniref:non-specific lipid-transfer protein 1-like n=1 Tax=Diospyros lotus TaxID=55363 RepID=UPI00224D0C94|nr:non-specific lipid-transfer protein 1-like [Diospyros lotus]